MSEQRTTKPNTSVDYFDEEDEEEEEDPYATDDDRDGNYSPPAVQKKKKIVEKNLTSKPVCKPKEKRTQNESKTKKFVATFDEKKKFAGYLEKEQLIWDLKHKLHANNHAQSAAWDRISAKMNKTGNFLHTYICVAPPYLTYHTSFQSLNARACIEPFVMQPDIEKKENRENLETVVVSKWKRKTQLIGIWKIIARFYSLRLQHEIHASKFSTNN